MQEVLPGVILDGAHNADGIAKLADAMKRIAAGRPVSLLFSAVSDKKYEDMIRELAQAAAFTSVTVTQTGGARHVETEVFAQIFRDHVKCPVYEEKDSRKAFELALRRREAGGVLFCAGSLYLAGEILSYLQEEGLAREAAPADSER